MPTIFKYYLIAVSSCFCASENFMTFFSVIFNCVEVNQFLSELLALFLLSLYLPCSANAAWYNPILGQTLCNLVFVSDFHFRTCFSHIQLLFEGLLYWSTVMLHKCKSIAAGTDIPPNISVCGQSCCGCGVPCLGAQICRDNNQCFTPSAKSFGTSASSDDTCVCTILCPAQHSLQKVFIFDRKKIFWNFQFQIIFLFAALYRSWCCRVTAWQQGR